MRKVKKILATALVVAMVTSFMLLIEPLTDTLMESTSPTNSLYPLLSVTYGKAYCICTFI